MVSRFVVHPSWDDGSPNSTSWPIFWVDDGWTKLSNPKWLQLWLVALARYFETFNRGKLIVACFDPHLTAKAFCCASQIRNFNKPNTYCQWMEPTNGLKSNFNQPKTLWCSDLRISMSAEPLRDGSADPSRCYLPSSLIQIIDRGEPATMLHPTIPKIYDCRSHFSCGNLMRILETIDSWTPSRNEATAFEDPNKIWFWSDRFQ